jgi:hypothetical protein
MPASAAASRIALAAGWTSFPPLIRSERRKRTTTVFRALGKGPAVNSRLTEFEIDRIDGRASRASDEDGSLGPIGEAPARLHFEILFIKGKPRGSYPAQELRIQTHLLEIERVSLFGRALLDQDIADGGPSLREKRRGDEGKGDKSETQDRDSIHASPPGIKKLARPRSDCASKARRNFPLPPRVEFSLPAIAVIVVNGRYNFIDRIFIGHGMGTDALAGRSPSRNLRGRQKCPGDRCLGRHPRPRSGHRARSLGFKRLSETPGIPTAS